MIQSQVYVLTKDASVESMDTGKGSNLHGPPNSRELYGSGPPGAPLSHPCVIRGRSQPAPHHRWRVRDPALRATGRLAASDLHDQRGRVLATTGVLSFNRIKLVPKWPF